MPSSARVPLLPAPAELELAHLIVESSRLVVVATARGRSAACPACGTPARRVHSRYERRLADLSWHGLAVTLRVQVRRFRCEAALCPRRIFCERLPATAAVYARRTGRLTEALELIGLALGGEAGARLARQLGLPTSPDTVLRVLQAGAATALPHHPVRVLGIDDWAWCRGQRYGTILVDGERHCVLDLLPDRTAETLVAWLTAHPEIEYVTRDRAVAYGEAIRRGAPQATQIADRFHLVQNLTEALERVLAARLPALRAAARAAQQRRLAPAGTGNAGPAEAPPPRPPERQLHFRRRHRPHATTHEAERTAAKTARRQRRLEEYTTVHELHAMGLSQFAIHRVLGLCRPRVRKYLASATFPERACPGPRRDDRRDHWRGVVRDSVARGVTSALRLWEALRAEGCPASKTTVWRWYDELRQAAAVAQPAAAPTWQAHPDVQAAAAVLAHTTPTDRILGHAGDQLLRTPSPRATTWLLLKPAAELEPDERQYVAAVYQHAPEVAEARRLAVEFVRVLHERDLGGYDGWQRAALASPHGPLRAFAHGLKRDDAAVRAALELPWSNGVTEGAVTKLKLIKRTMYGRASLPLLRRCLLAA